MRTLADPYSRLPAALEAGVPVRGGLLVDAGRSSREDERRGRPVADRLPGRGPCDQFAVDASLADPARDQLAVLRSEIEDQHQVLCRYPALRDQLVPSPACGRG